MNNNYRHLDPELIKNALESDSDITTSNSNLLISLNSSSERDFERAIENVEKQIEKEDTNDVIPTYSESDADESNFESSTAFSVISESNIGNLNDPHSELQPNPSVLCSIDHLFPDEEAYRNCNYLKPSIQTLVNIENKINTTDHASYYSDFQHISQSIPFVKRSPQAQLPPEITCIATCSSKLYLGTANGEILFTCIDYTQQDQPPAEKLYTPSSPSAAITCICISRDAKWFIIGHQNGLIQLLQLEKTDKPDQGVIQGFNFLRGSKDKDKTPAVECLNVLTSLSCPKIPLNFECLNKTNWDLFLSICKGFATTEYSLCVFSITSTVLSYKLTMAESLPFHNLSLTYQPGMVSTEIDLEIITIRDDKKPAVSVDDSFKRPKDTFCFSIFQPGLVHMMSYSKNKSINLVNTVNINISSPVAEKLSQLGDLKQNNILFDRQSIGVWVRSASTFKSVLFIVDAMQIHLISSNGDAISFDAISQFNIPYEIASLTRLSLSIVVAVDLKGGIHFFQVLGYKDKLGVVKFGGTDDFLSDFPEIKSVSSVPLVYCGMSEMNAEAKGCKKFVATVNSIVNSANITRKTVPSDTFLCKFGYVCIFAFGKLHTFYISSWYDILCRLAFNKKFSKSLQIISGIYQNKLPRLLEFQSKRYEDDTQKLLLYTLHQSCAQVVKMKKELGMNEFFPSDQRLHPLNNLCNILIESCLATNMYNELVGLLFRSFNGIGLANLFASQFLYIIIKKYRMDGSISQMFPIAHNSSDDFTVEEFQKPATSNLYSGSLKPFPLGLPLTESISLLFRNAFNEINAGSETLEPIWAIAFTNFKNIDLNLCGNEFTDSMLRYYFTVKLLHQVSNYAVNDISMPIILEPVPLQNVAIEFELWNVLVKLKMSGLTCESLVYLFDTLALQLLKLRESTFEKSYPGTFYKLKKLSLPLIPPPDLYRNTCLANTFTSLWAICDYNDTLDADICKSNDGFNYFLNDFYREIFVKSLKDILIMSFGSENVTDSIVYTADRLLHPILTESILLAPNNWFKYSIHNIRYLPVLKTHYHSYNLEFDKFIEPEVVTMHKYYVENAFKLYAFSFMIYYALGDSLDSFDKWDDLLLIYQSPLMIYSEDVVDDCEVSDLLKPHYYGSCPVHQLNESDSANEDDHDNVLFSTKNDLPKLDLFKKFFKNSNFDITYHCKCYRGLLLSLLGLLVKRLIPFSSPPNQLIKLAQLPLEFSVEDKSTIFEALYRFDDIFSLLDADNLSKFLLNHFDFVEIDEDSDELEITSPRQPHYLLTWSVVNNIKILKHLDINTVRRVLFYTLSSESLKLMINGGVLTNLHQMADNLLNSLEDYPELQADVYILLMKNVKEKLGKFDHLLELLCQRKCKRLIPLLKREPKLDIQKCLDVADKKYPFPEAKSYLLERAGNIHAALNGIYDFDEIVEITIRAIGKISDHSLLSRWIDLLDNHPKSKASDQYANYVISKVSKSLAKLSTHGLDIAEYPDLIGKYVKYLERYPDVLLEDTNNDVIALFRKILRSLDMKRGVLIETLQLVKQSMDVQVAKRMKSLSRGILIGKDNDFSKANQPFFSMVCGGCNRILKVDDQMRIFFCGHMFHIQCKPELVCPLH